MTKYYVVIGDVVYPVPFYDASKAYEFANAEQARIGCVPRSVITESEYERYLQTGKL